MCGRLGAGLFLERFLLEVFLDEVPGGLLGTSLTAVGDWAGLNDFFSLFYGPLFFGFSLLIFFGLLAKRLPAGFPKESFFSLIPTGPGPAERRGCLLFAL